MLGKSRNEFYQVKGKILYELTFEKLTDKFSPDPVPTLDLFICLFIHLFNKHLLSACHVLGTASVSHKSSTNNNKKKKNSVVFGEGFLDHPV